MTANTTNYTFWILGGDLRQHWLAKQLAEDGHFVHSYGLCGDFLLSQPEEHLHQETSLTHCKKEDIIIFPLPMANKEGFLTAPFHPNPLTLEEILDHLHPEQFILGGQVNQTAETLATSRNLTLFDYFKREELTIANAVPTAEGCIQIAMERLPITLQDAKILILGYGFVAKATAQRFGALGAKVTIAARRSAPLAQAKADGFTPLPLHQIPHQSQAFSCVVNTIPSQVIEEPQLKAFPNSCPIIDLASSPGGIDLETAEQLHRTIIPALSLPGKVAPATAGFAIKETLYIMLEQQTYQERTEL